MPSSVRAGESGTVRLALPVVHAHPSCDTPGFSLTHEVVVAVEVLGGEPVELRAPVELLVPAEGYREVETSEPVVVGDTADLGLDLPVRRAGRGGVVAATATVGGKRPATLTLRRVHQVHSVADPFAGAAARDDVVIDEVEVSPAGVTSAELRVPDDAAPTCITRWGQIRWYVRLERPATWRHGMAVVEVEVNVHSG